MKFDTTLAISNLRHLEQFFTSLKRSGKQGMYCILINVILLIGDFSYRILELNMNFQLEQTRR